MAVDKDRLWVPGRGWLRLMADAGNGDPPRPLQHDEIEALAACLSEDGRYVPPAPVKGDYGMPAKQARDALYALLLYPCGTVNIWSWHEDDGSISLIVNVTAGYLAHAQKHVPTTFEGYAVRVRELVPATAG